MREKILTLLPMLCLLCSCGGPSKGSSGTDDNTYYVFYMNNYPRVDDIAPSGNPERMDNTLFLRQEIKLGQKLVKPSPDPTRENYEFGGWFKEKGCLNEWNFESDVPESSLYLYAKWQQTKSEEYVEPEYVYPETFIEDANYRVTGILNSPVIVTGTGMEVNLATGAINRLKNGKDDVSFAVNHERKSGVNLTTATYDITNMKIHLAVSSGETFDINVNDISASLSIASENTTYENKAEKYETLGTTYENYHIALAGSSSMENWATSALDMSPIVTFNHGIGGTTVQQWTDKLFERLVLPYSPKAVAYYVGVNNIINGDHESGTATGNHLVELFDKTHQYLPNTQIFYVMINRLPSYSGTYQNDFDAANNAALAYAQQHDYLICINAGKDLVKEDGVTPNAAYFLTDGLHMSKYGYVIWGAAVKEAIIAWLDKKQ